jgi:hypothetical protein
MSRGNRVILTRFDPETVAEIERIVAKSIDSRREEPWTLSSFVRSAVAEKLDKMRRSRRRRKKKVSHVDVGNGPVKGNGRTVELLPATDEVGERDTGVLRGCDAG